MPSTSRGPGRENEDAASTATTREAPRLARSLAVGSRLLGRLVGVEPARHHDGDVRPGRGDLLPARRARLHARRSRARPRRPRARSSPAPSGRRRTAGRATPAPPPAGGRRPATAARTRSMPGLEPARERARRAPARPPRSATRAMSPAPRPSVSRVERDHLGRRGQALGDGPDVVVGDGADRAQRLGHDQVGLERAPAPPRRACRAPPRGPVTSRTRASISAGGSPSAMTLAVSRGSRVAASGWSHSCVTATTLSPRPSAKRISVADGTRLAIRTS